MKKLMVGVFAVCAAVMCARARTVAIDSVEKDGDGLETAFNLVLGAGTETSDTLYMVYGATDGGDSVGAWSMAMRVGDIPAETTALKVSAPQYWGEKYFYIRFAFRDGVDGLPFDNAVEWVAKGNKCDTLYAPNNNSRLVLDVQTFVGKDDGKTEYWAGVWDVNWTTKAFAICTDGSAQYVAFNSSLGTVAKRDIGRYTFDLSKDGYFINGVKAANCSANEFQIEHTLYLFCQDRIGAPFGSSGDAQFYSVQISESGGLVRDYIPVVKDGRAYFYDRVNGKPDHGPLYEMTNDKATFGDILDIRTATGLVITPAEDGWSGSYVKAEIAAEPDPYAVSYDAQPHAARIVLGYPTDATLEWSTDGGATYVADAPAWTDAGEYACLCRVSKAGLNAKIVETSVTITAIPLADCAAEPIPPQGYEPGDAAPEPQPVLTYNGYTLVVGTDVECAYSGNTSWGTATVTVTPKTGNATGTRELKFSVNPKVPITGDCVYVRPNGTGHGTSWSDALGSPSIGVTLALASKGAKEGMFVGIAEGSYEIDKGIEFLRESGLTVSGGWDPATDARTGTSVFAAADALRTAIVTVRESEGIVLEGLTLRGALNYAAADDACGGALDVDCATNFVLSGCAILDSCAYTAGSRVHTLGGGACFRRSVGVAVSNSVFRNNRVIAAEAIAKDRPSLGGGGAAFLSTSGEVVGSVFAGNRATGKPNDLNSAFGAWGGGVLLELYDRSDEPALLDMVFTNCLIAGNATYLAASADATYRGLLSFDSATANVGNNTMGPGCGAGVWSYRGTFSGCSIVDNPGEAINTPELDRGCFTTFNDCIVRGNLTAIGNCLWRYAKFNRCNVEYYDCSGIANQARGTGNVDLPTGFGPDWSATADEMAACGYHPAASAFAAPRTVNVADAAGLVAALGDLGDNDTLVLAEGTYALTAPVRLAGRTRVVLAGAGKGRTVLDFGGVSRGLEIDGCADVEVRDLTVTNAFVSGAVAQGAGVFALCSGNVRFVRAEVTGCVAETGAEATGTTRGGGFLLSAATVDFAESDITGCRVRSAATTATVGPAAIEALGATRVVADRLRITGNAIDSAAAKGSPAAVAVRLMHAPCLNINKHDVIGHWPGLPKFRQTLIADNTAPAYGNIPAFYGSQWSLESTTIAGNVWTRGATAYGWGIDTELGGGNHFMTNSVLGGHVVDFRNRQYQGRPYYAHSCIQTLVHAGNDGGTSEQAYFEADTSEMIVGEDPLFRGRGADPWQLRKGSPCVDRALRADWMTKEATDLVGKRRVYGAGPDLGAYECIPPGLLLMVW